MPANNAVENRSSIDSDVPITSSILEDMLLLWREIKGLGHDHFQLAALEAQRAGQSLTNMLVFGIMLALLLNGVWIGLVAAAVLKMIENGISTSNAILLGVVGNLLLGLVCCIQIRRNSQYLQFPDTLRSLQRKPYPKQEKNS